MLTNVILFTTEEYVTIFAKIVKLSTLPVLSAILDIRQAMLSTAVGRVRVHAARFVTAFRYWNDIGICNYRNVICISGFRPPFCVLGTR